MAGNRKEGEKGRGGKEGERAKHKARYLSHCFMKEI